MRCTFLLIPFLFTLPIRSQGIDFEKEIQPIFKKRCYACHGAKRQKGKLRLDQKSGLFGEDSKSWAVVPGKPAESDLLRRLRLEKGADEAMPPKGKRLTPEQIQAIERWIAAGATWGGDSKPRHRPTPYRAGPKLPKVDATRRASEEAAITRLTKAGLATRRIAANSRGVDVDMSLVRRPVADVDLELLNGLEGCLVSLNLSGTKVSSKGIATLERFTQLRRLNLSKISLDGEGLRHLPILEHLSSLNLYGTSVGDDAIEHLAAFPSLRRLYLWETRITKKGADALGRKRPRLVIDRGIERRPVQTPPAPLKVINALCPLTGTETKDTCIFLYRGRAIGFCCAKCLAKFKKQPEKYLAKIPEWKGPGK